MALLAKLTGYLSRQSRENSLSNVVHRANTFNFDVVGRFKLKRLERMIGSSQLEAQFARDKRPSA